MFSHLRRQTNDFLLRVEKNRIVIIVQNFEWFHVEHLPAHKKDNTCKHLGLSPNSFFMVIPFVKYVLQIFFVPFWHGKSIACFESDVCI